MKVSQVSVLNFEKQINIVYKNEYDMNLNFKNQITKMTNKLHLMWFSIDINE